MFFMKKWLNPNLFTRFTGSDHPDTIPEAPYDWGEFLSREAERMPLISQCGIVRLLYRAGSVCEAGKPDLPALMNRPGGGCSGNP